MEELIWECHLSLGHAGFKKCHRALTESFIGKGLAKRMKRLLSTCDLCQKCKHPNLSTRVEMQTIQAKEKGELLAIDDCGPLPKDVYKRQVFSGNPHENPVEFLRLFEAYVTRVNPVSYTHLDVYKRQVL